MGNPLAVKALKHWYNKNVAVVNHLFLQPVEITQYRIWDQLCFPLPLGDWDSTFAPSSWLVPFDQKKNTDVKKIEIIWNISTLPDHVEKKFLTDFNQICFLIGGERVTCHWSKLHDALGQQQLELSTRTWSGRALLKPRQICLPAASSK